MSGDPIKFPIDPDNGMIIGPDDCHYDNEKQVFAHAVLGMCGCGDPEEAYNFIRGALMLADRRDNLRDRSIPWIDLEKALAEAISNQPSAAAHAFLHLLDTRGVLEHGGSVGGSWTTALGNQIIDAGPVGTELDHDE